MLGANYWPRSSAMRMWERFDLGEIDADFARMAALGMDVVRFFILWEDFQPAPDTVATLAIERFMLVLDRVAANGLTAMPTLFTGHMSGCNYLPAWTLDRSTRSQRFRTITLGGESPYAAADFYTGELLEAQRFFARTIGERARDHGAILAWDLGNEFSNLRPPNSPAEGAHWSAALTSDLFTSSNLPVTGGIHGEDIAFERNIRPSSMCEPWAFATMHGYPAYSAFARSPDDPEVVPYLFEVTRSLSGKPVFFTELGTPTCPPGVTSVGGHPCLADEPAAVYARNVLPRLAERGALGAMWWCWTDYAEDLYDTPPFDLAPHERQFGIVRADGTERPVARVIADFARERRPIVEPLRAPMFDEAEHYANLPQSVDSEYHAYCEAYVTAGTRA